MEAPKQYSVTATAPGGLDLPSTLLCGQAFRWVPDGGGYVGVAHSKAVRVLPCTPDSIQIIGADENDYITIWRRYFDLDRDYATVRAEYSDDALLQEAFSFCRGMRILNQQPWETLISFIISSNNNVRRISGIIENIAAALGEPIEFEGRTLYAFPEPGVLARATEAQLVSCGAGYRAPYIKKAAQAVAEGFDIEALSKTDEAYARQQLMSLSGVGPKVADCIMLFSLGFTRAFPVDRWIGRIMRRYTEGNCSYKQLQEHADRLFGPNAGIAQQYLFHYVRHNPAVCLR